MTNKDARVDAYIAKSADFAKPILRHLRDLIHQACPEVEETMKWSFPHFDYKGMMCSMAAFKSHCVFGFWKGALLAEVGGPSDEKNRDAMGQFGRITQLTDLPSDKKLIALIKRATKLNDAGVKLPSKPKPARPKAVRAPAYFLAALKQNRKALATYQNLSPSHKREYVEWITEAKTDETRLRRMSQALEWLEQGKSRNWRYEKK